MSPSRAGKLPRPQSVSPYRSNPSQVFTDDSSEDAVDDSTIDAEPQSNVGQQNDDGM